MYRQSEKKLLNIDTSSTCPHNMVNFSLVMAERSVGEFGAPLQISTGFASRQRYCAALNGGRHLYLAGQPSRWALAHILVATFFIWVWWIKIPWNDPYVAAICSLSIFINNFHHCHYLSCLQSSMLALNSLVSQILSTTDFYHNFLQRSGLVPNFPCESVSRYLMDCTSVSTCLMFMYCG